MLAMHVQCSYMAHKSHYGKYITIICMNATYQ